MSLLDSILQQVEGSDAVAGLAAKVGLPMGQVQSIGDSLRTQLGGDATAEPAAELVPADADGAAVADQAEASGGLMDKLNGMAGAGGVAGAVSGMLDRDGDGNPINDVLGFAKGLFASKS